MTLIFSLLIFNLGFVAGAWWATRIARQQSNAASLQRSALPFQRVKPRAPLYTFDPIASQN